MELADWEGYLLVTNFRRNHAEFPYLSFLEINLKFLELGFGASFGSHLAAVAYKESN